MSRTILSAALVQHIYEVMEGAAGPAGTTRTAWRIRVGRALRPLGDGPVGVTDAQLNRVIRVLDEATGLAADESWAMRQQEALELVASVRRA